MDKLINNLVKLFKSLILSTLLFVIIGLFFTLSTKPVILSCLVYFLFQVINGITNREVANMAPPVAHKIDSYVGRPRLRNAGQCLIALTVHNFIS